MASVPKEELSSLLRQIHSNFFLNRQLSSICQLNGVKSTGVKAELQNRIAQLLQDCFEKNDWVKYQQVRQTVVNTATSGPNAVVSAFPTSHNHRPAPHQHYPAIPAPVNTQEAMPRPTGHPSGGGSGGASLCLNFKPSPFYDRRALVDITRVCEPLSQHKNTLSISLPYGHHSLQQCANDSSLRIMVFCAGETAGIQDISFPQQAEIRVNGQEVRANLRGLKNKPGSTRPADITSRLVLRPNFSAAAAGGSNTMEFTYALTTKKFYLALYLCKITSVEELVAKLRTGRKILRESVVSEIAKKSQDPDVVATSQVLSLKCPISCIRLGLPCRGLECTHVQCFDGTSYLQLQEQGPQWLCPICSKAAPFHQLATDEYVGDILRRTSSSLDQVTIEPDGRWLIPSTDPVPERTAHGPSSSDDELDEVVVSSFGTVGGRASSVYTSQRYETVTTNSSTPGPTTPHGGLLLSSTTAPTTAMTTAGMAAGATMAPAAAAPATTSVKRPISEVIDLTLSSDDEDDQPIARPPKRQHIGFGGGF